MARFIIHGEVISFSQNQKNIRVHNADAMKQFWKDEDIDTILGWAGDQPPLSTVSVKELVDRCEVGDIVDYTIETVDRKSGRGVRGVDLRVIVSAR